MDPNANLQEQERILITRNPWALDTPRLVDLRQALYDWIRDGGFEPDWSKAPTAAAYYGH